MLTVEEREVVSRGWRCWVELGEMRGCRGRSETESKLSRRWLKYFFGGRKFEVAKRRAKRNSREFGRMQIETGFLPVNTQGNFGSGRERVGVERYPGQCFGVDF